MSGVIKQLYFFDKRGNNTNADIINNCYFYNLYLEPVSVDLYTYENITLLQKVRYKENNIPYEVFCLPHSTWGTNEIIAEIEDKDSGFNFIINNNGYIQEVKNLSLHIDNAYTTDDNTGSILETENIKREPVQLIIAGKFSKEGSYSDKITLKTTDGVIIARIGVYTEVVDLDERLRNNLLRLGLKDVYEDWRVFKETDINEYLVDYKILNTKLKEKLAVGHLIDSYIGTLCGLSNALKFYGYPEIKIKNYLKNIQKDSPYFNKIILNDIDKEYNTNVYNKTKYIALVYNFNKITSKYDEDNLPIVEDMFMYTMDEILIKLYNLKNILQKNYLGILGIIKDIIGEGDWFSGMRKITSTGKNTTPYYLYGDKIKLNITTNGYISDLRSVEEMLHNGIGLDEDVLSPNNLSVYIKDVTNVFLLYFNYFNQFNNTILPDNPDATIGCPVLLDIRETFQFTFDDFNNVAFNSFIINNAYIDFKFYTLSSAIVPNKTITITNQDGSLSYTYTTVPFDSVPSIVTTIYNNIINLFPDWEVELINNDTLRFKLIAPITNTIKFINTSNIIIEQNTNTYHSFYAIDYLTFKDYYEIEYIITGPNNYKYTIRGKLVDLLQLPLVLPFVGDYDIIIKLYDLNNNCFTSIFKKAITINSLIPYGTIITYNNQIQYTIEDLSSYNIDDIHFLIFDIQYDITNMPTMDDLEYVTFESLNIANYINTFNDTKTYVGLKTYDTNTNSYMIYNSPYFFDNLDTITFDDINNLNLNDSAVTNDIYTSFVIPTVTAGSTLVLKHIVTGNTTIYTFTSNNLVTEANNLNTSNDEILQLFHFNVIYDTFNNPQYILAVSKFSGINSYIDILPSSTNAYNNLILSQVYNFNFFNFKVLNSRANINNGAYLFFNFFDEPLIKGKVLYDLKINNKLFTNTSGYFTYLVDRSIKDINISIKDNYNNIHKNNLSMYIK